MPGELRRISYNFNNEIPPLIISLYSNLVSSLFILHILENIIEFMIKCEMILGQRSQEGLDIKSKIGVEEDGTRNRPRDLSTRFRSLRNRKFKTPFGQALLLKCAIL